MIIFSLTLMNFMQTEYTRIWLCFDIIMAESSQKLRCDLEFGPCAMYLSFPLVMLGSAVPQNLRETENVTDSTLAQTECCTA